MIEILILAAILTAKIYSVDRHYAQRGETPPGYRLIEKWLDGRKARGKAEPDARPARYGAWRYFWQRWCAMWETLSQEHQLRHEAGKRQRAEAAARGELPPPRPGWRERKDRAWQWVVDQVDVPQGQPKPTEPSPEPDPKPSLTCEKCNQTLVVKNGVLEHPSSAGCPAQAQPESRPEPHPAEPGQPDEFRQRLDPAQPDQQDHAPAPAENGHHPEGETTVQPTTAQPNGTQPTTTQQSGEVTGLTSMINYAAAVASAHEAHALAGGETYMSSLRQAEAGPQTLGTAATAQEASQIAGAAWREHEAELRKQLAAKEHTTEETVNKQALLAE